VAKKTTNLSAQDRVILFCVAARVHYADVGIGARAMQSMSIRGFIEHHGPTGAYMLTASGRATLAEILDEAGLP
jgi:hypothetical protein